MSRSWNGESLVNELSALLGDTSTAFKARVLGWANDVIFDISSRHDWGHHLVKGKKILIAEQEIQDLEVEAPEACDIELETGGSLAEGSVYSVLFTYVQDNGVETIAGEESDSVTTNSSQLSISLTNIPTSSESLVTKRSVYLKKDDEDYYFHSQIDDNFSTSLTIDTDTDSTIEPPDYSAIRRLKGSPFFEETANSSYLEYRDTDQIRRLTHGDSEFGDPEYFSPIEYNSIALYPIPSTDLEISFNYYRNPFKLYNSPTSQPDIPIYLKPTLKAGVIALGFEYRDRSGQEAKRAIYEQSLNDAINKGGKVASIEYVVRDIYGNCNGFEVY
jgi:hypothetical protein